MEEGKDRRVIWRKKLEKISQLPGDETVSRRRVHSDRKKKAARLIDTRRFRQRVGHKRSDIHGRTSTEKSGSRDSRLGREAILV